MRLLSLLHGTAAILDQIPGAYLAKRYGGKMLLVISFLLGGGLSGLTALPAANPKYVISGVVMCRLAVGMAQGVFFPAAQSVLAHWIPPADRGLHFAIAISGMFAGVATAMMTVPILGETKKCSWAGEGATGMVLHVSAWFSKVVCGLGRTASNRIITWRWVVKFEGILNVLEKISRLCCRHVDTSACFINAKRGCWQFWGLVRS